MTTDLSLPHVTLAVDGMFLVSWWKPLLLFLPILGWAWVVSTIYDKDAARWYFKRQAWNLAHVAVAVLAVAIVLFAPVPFFFTFPAFVALLIGDLAAYFVLRNGDDRVPEQHKWSLDLSKMAEQSAAKRKKSQLANVSMVIQGPSGEIAPPEKETPEYEVRIAVEELIGEMLDARGSQLDIHPARERENVYVSSFMVDGVRQKPKAVPAPQAIAIIDFLKGAAD
ncbi:MAG: hypothetical protein AAFX05_13420, partial [Planctomycetota bacterium]